jgi:pSer/pThr/pTyr-binding forkhead associated (FHA) protein
VGRYIGPVPFLVWDSQGGRNVRELDRALVVIGRDAGSDLVIDDPTVSRRHALVQVDATVRITDLRTTAGTRINGARLAPDIPCTLEPGDFLQVGKVVLSFHAAPPPPAPPSPPPEIRRPSRAARALPWKPAAIALAFAAVVGAAVLLALPGRGEPQPAPLPSAVAARSGAVPEPPPPPVPPEAVPPEAVPAEEDRAPAKAEPSPRAGPERAAEGELPPRDGARGLPDLLEVDGKTHLPARVRTLGDSIEVIGADGRLYAMPAKRVTRIEDRADLARRVAVARRRLAPDDVAGRVALAEWCLRRLLGEEARALVREALSLAPQDAAARALDARLREQE